MRCQPVHSKRQMKTSKVLQIGNYILLCYMNYCLASIRNPLHLYHNFVDVQLFFNNMDSSSLP